MPLHLIRLITQITELFSVRSLMISECHNHDLYAGQCRRVRMKCLCHALNIYY
nr:MAG TPA: hypothetical protein [Caudoviricetes sp.]